MLKGYLLNALNDDRCLLVITASNEQHDTLSQECPLLSQITCSMSNMRRENTLACSPKRMIGLVFIEYNEPRMSYSDNVVL